MRLYQGEEKEEEAKQDLIKSCQPFKQERKKERKKENKEEEGGEEKEKKLQPCTCRFPGYLKVSEIISVAK